MDIRDLKGKTIKDAMYFSNQEKFMIILEEGEYIAFKGIEEHGIAEVEQEEKEDLSSWECLEVGLITQAEYDCEVSTSKVEDDANKEKSEIETYYRLKAKFENRTP